MHDHFESGTELFKNLPQEKREKVFDAAVAEFASKGYRNASMNSLVRAAGISKGSIFQYFRTKRNLFDAVLELAVDQVKNYLRKVRSDTGEMPFPVRLGTLLRSGFSFIDKHPLLSAIYFQLLQSGDAPFGTEKILKLRKLGNEFLAEMLVEAVTHGEVRSDLDRQKTAFLVNSLMETLLRAYYTEFLDSGLGLYKGSHQDRETWIETTVAFIVSGLGNESSD